MTIIKAIAVSAVLGFFGVAVVVGCAVLVLIVMAMILSAAGML